MRHLKKSVADYSARLQVAQTTNAEQYAAGGAHMVSENLVLQRKLEAADARIEQYDRIALSVSSVMKMPRLLRFIESLRLCFRSISES